MTASFRRTRVLPIHPARPQWRRVRLAAAAIGRGELLVIPTDTVYGLAADPFCPAAVERIFHVKKRGKNQPLLLLIDSLEQLPQLVADVPPALPKIAADFWPGPLTVILPAGPKAPREITAGTDTVAVRVPAAPLTRAIIRASGGLLTGTSANLSGRPPASTAAEAARQFRGSVYYIVDGGPAPCRQPSTILDLSANTPRIVRQGSLPWTRLARYLP